MTKHIHIQGEEDPKTTEEQAAEAQADTASQSDSQDLPEEPDQDEAVDKLKEAQQAAQDHYDRLLRVSAEFDNYKKRTAREMQEVIKFANEKIAADLLSVVDNLERALISAKDQSGDENPLVQGVSLVLDEIVRVLEKYHIKPIKALGEPFDPALHQAMMQECTDECPPNTVVKEMQKGYLIQDRLLRPTLVAVSAAVNDKNNEMKES